MNQPAHGITCILFCWTFIPAFLGLLEFFVFLSMSQKTFDLKYNSRRGIVSPNYGVVRKSNERSSMENLDQEQDSVSSISIIGSVIGELVEDMVDDSEDLEDLREELREESEYYDD